MSDKKVRDVRKEAARPGHRAAALKQVRRRRWALSRAKAGK